MNFDANTLSTLMKLMGAMKPSRPEEREDKYDDRSSEKNANSTASVSVFAMQNGLGQKVEIGGSKQKSEARRPAGPMASILEMMTGGGGSGDSGGDMMSTLMPMLMNMMNMKNQPQNQTSKAACENNNPKNASDNRQSNDEKYNENGSQRTGGSQNKNTTSADMKTQPSRKNMFEPIAFAGYTLISALNKLYAYMRV